MKVKFEAYSVIEGSRKEKFMLMSEVTLPRKVSFKEAKKIAADLNKKIKTLNL